AVTVRFENGGSLSLRLTMREGEIASQFQTDVPGLENALRSSWGQFAQDSQHKGWRLASPTFTSAASHHEQQGQGQNQGQQREGRPADQQAFPGGAGFTLSSQNHPARRARSSTVTVSHAQDSAPGLDRASASNGWTTWA
ncbi:MAG: hypothetical protein ACREIA_19470, partial [Opitutaceae bacterium]